MKVLFLLFISFFSIYSHALIIGADNRKVITRQQAEKLGFKPSVYMFILKPTGKVVCSGSWISKTHILTAKHCVANAKKILVYNQYEGYLSIYKAHGKRVFVGSDSSDNQNDWYNGYGESETRPHREDWAVLEIVEEKNEPESEFLVDASGNFILRPDGQKILNMQRYGDGSTMGFYKLKSSALLEQNPTVKVATYHNDADNGLYTEQCQYRPRTFYASYKLMYRPGLMEIDCDMMSGASGSSILSCQGTDCSVVGVFSGEYPTEPTKESAEGTWVPEFSYVNSNVATKSDNFIRPVLKLLKGDWSEVKHFALQQAKCKLQECFK